MRRLAIALGSMTLLWGTSALAQVGNISASAGSAYITPGLECVSSVCFNTNPLPAGEGGFPNVPGATGGSYYNSFVDIGRTSIFFESSNSTSQGPYTRFESSSTVAFEFTNPEDGPIAFHSEITPQGLGMYLADTSGGCVFTNSCVQVSDQLHQFAELAEGITGPAILGGVGFTFDILDNESTIYSLAGVLSLQVNTEACGSGFCIVNQLGAAAETLEEFAQQTHVDDFSAIAYGWGATDVNLTLGSGFHFIEYRTRAFSFTNAPCLDETVCLVAYSGFGDPIGRGGGIDAASAGLGGQLGSFQHMGGAIQGLDFRPGVFNLPTYDFANNRLTFDSDGVNGSVPEPTTWALMILGFGAMGAALRRRRIPAHI